MRYLRVWSISGRRVSVVTFSKINRDMLTASRHIYIPYILMILSFISNYYSWTRISMILSPCEISFSFSLFHLSTKNLETLKRLSEQYRSS